MGKNTASLWDFSCAFYAQETVAEACHQLQDRWACDVNLVMLCFWAGARGLAPDISLWRTLQQCSSRWQSGTITPLRQLRRRMKAELDSVEPSLRDEFISLRESIKDSELRGEELEQRALETLVLEEAQSLTRQTSGEACMRSNVQSLLSVMGLPADAALTDCCERLLGRAAVFYRTFPAGD